MNHLRHILLFVLWTALAGGTSGSALVLPEVSGMVPHRAVYEISLGKATSAAGITDVRGRLVFEFTGSVCEGFAQNMRFVMEITDREGTAKISDLRSSTWEGADGDTFRFEIENLEPDQAADTEKTVGKAVRDTSGQVEIALTKPAHADLTFAGPVYFPLQHTAALIAAAKRGDKRLEALVYDGSDLGQKLFETATAIGNAGAGDESELDGVANAQSLKGQPSWPMTIAYFGTESDLGPGTPEHEMSFRVYPNGVIRSVKLDYGTLTLDGRLSQIEFLTPKACSP
ncbi:MAG: cell envelope integrity EipB family protein [Hyphomicrobiaceae bacterium]